MNHLTFQQFTKEIVTSIKSYLPTEYADAFIDIQRIPKPGNKILTGIVIRQSSQGVSPIIYLDDAYQEYLNGQKLDTIVQGLATTIQNRDFFIPDMRLYSEWERAKKLVVSRLINTKLNTVYIADRPVTSISGSDIGIIYDLDLSRVATDEMLSPVTYAHMERWGVTLPDIASAAQENNPRLRPVRIQSLGQMLSDAIADVDIQGVDNLLYVITNDGLSHGAVAVTYPGVNEQIKLRLGEYYLIPSSIHEMLAVSQNKSNPEDLAQLIQSINSSQVPPEDVLDNIPYVLQDGCLIPAIRTTPMDIPSCDPVIPFS